MKNLGERLFQIGIGGFYRTTVGPDRVEVRGPYPTRNLANPYEDARLPGLSVYSAFRLRRPKDAIAPDPMDLESFK